MKKTAITLILLLVLSACIPEHEKMLRKMAELDAISSNYDSIPNDTDALDVVLYMEKNGTVKERQDAWKMLAKVYRRKGWSWNEELSYCMAVGCIDTTQAFDTLAFAQTLYEWSHCLNRTLDGDHSRSQLMRAIRYAELAGDSITAMRYRGDVESERAYRYLKDHGRMDLAVDAGVEYLGNCISELAHARMCRKKEPEIKELARQTSQMMREYPQYTQNNITNPYSYEAEQYWWLCGCWHKAEERLDSAIHYYKKMLQLGEDYHWELSSRACYALYECYDSLGNRDSAIYYLDKDLRITEFYSHHLTEDRFLSRLQDYRFQHDLSEMTWQTEREHLLLVVGAVVLIFLISIAAICYQNLRKAHRAVLEQNREYVEMLNLLQAHASVPVMMASISQHFHELSSQDSHPSEEDWHLLQEEVNRQYPNLFSRISRHYAPGISTQEQRVICLIAIRCTPLQMSVLLVCTKSNISNLRRRVYRKLTGKDGSGADLDELVNSLCRDNALRRGHVNPDGRLPE